MSLLLWYAFYNICLNSNNFRKYFRMKCNTFQQITDFIISVFLIKLTPLNIVSELLELFHFFTEICSSFLSKIFICTFKLKKKVYIILFKKYKQLNIFDLFCCLLRTQNEFRNPFYTFKEMLAESKFKLYSL